MSTLARRDTMEIVPADPDVLPDLGLATECVDQLVRDVDDETLREFRNRAEAHRLYQVRSQNVRQANHFARMKLLAEQGLGALSIADHPQIGRSVTPEMNYWRALAMGHQRGAMLSVCDELEEAGSEISTMRVARILRKRGWTRVDRREFASLIDERAKAEGVTKSKLGARLGLYSAQLYVGNRSNRGMMWPVVCRMASVLDIDPLVLGPCPPQRRGPRKGPPLWTTRERRRTGSEWDKAYGYFRQCVDQFKNLAPNADPRWDKAYEHLYAIEQIIGGQMRDG